MSELIEKQLFWEKWRPNNIDDLILPERIKKIASGGLQVNYLFYGSSGCGKSSLAKILLKEYPNSHLTLSSKLGVEELRIKVDRFCREMIPFEDPNKLRVVYFEEFDRCSSALQEELKSFIEDHSKRVRFLATCNNIGKIKKEVRSRFTEIDFAFNLDEVKDLKSKFGKRVLSICKAESLKVDKPVLIEILNKRFPDLRKVWQDVQYYHLTGFIESKKIMDNDEKLFEIIIDKKNSIYVWDYLMTEWSDKIEIAFQKLGKDFSVWIQQNKVDKIDKLGNSMIIVSEYTDLRLPNSLDPFVTLCALIYKLQEIYA